ncbi:Flavonoid 3',5'-methyltransferase-like protein [Drosera capensis]
MKYSSYQCFFKIMNAKKTIKIGVFTAYSLLTTVLALPKDGKVLAIDPNEEAYKTGLPFIQKARVDHKIDFVQADAKQVLQDLIAKGEGEGAFDFAFVDATKEDYIDYHEQLLKLVKVGGIIAHDNTLWPGSVALDESDPIEEFMRKGRGALIKLNSFLANDQSSLLSIGDGLTLCRWLY